MVWAIRFRVHRSVRYPAASGPDKRTSANLFFSVWDSLGGRPGITFERRALEPPSWYSWYHRKTELFDAPTECATAERVVLLSFSNSIARRRRFSSSSWDPWGLMPHIIAEKRQKFHYLCESQ